MKLDKMLATIRQSEAKPATEKVAAAAPKTEKVASQPSALESALNSALAEVAPAKTASEKSSPVADVMKIAADMAATEKEAALKEAQLLGAAFADAAMARFGELQAKTASLVSAPAAAAPSADLLKQAQQIGYEQARVELEKQANELYAQGYNDTVNQIHAAAADEFMKAAQVVNALIQDAR